MIQLHAACWVKSTMAVLKDLQWPSLSSKKEQHCQLITRKFIITFLSYKSHLSLSIGRNIIVP